MKIARRNYFILLLLSLVFLTPGISAYVFYTHPHWLGHTTTNKGIFLDPSELLPSLQPSNGSTEPKWHLVLWSPRACDESCIAQLDQLARIRLALGRRLYDVVIQLVLGANAPLLSGKFVQTLQEQDIHMLKLAVGASKDTPALKDQLQIFIANPDNYLVLAYQPTVKPEDIFHDMKQLLSTTEKHLSHGAAANSK